MERFRKLYVALFFLGYCFFSIIATYLAYQNDPSIRVAYIPIVVVFITILIEFYLVLFKDITILMVLVDVNYKGVLVVLLFASPMVLSFITPDTDLMHIVNSIIGVLSFVMMFVILNVKKELLTKGNY